MAGLRVLLVALAVCCPGLLMVAEAQTGCGAGSYGPVWGAAQANRYCDPSTHDSSGDGSVSSCKARCEAQGSSSCAAITYYPSTANCDASTCYLCQTGYTTQTSSCNGVIYARPCAACLCRSIPRPFLRERRAPRAPGASGLAAWSLFSGLIY